MAKTTLLGVVTFDSAVRLSHLPDKLVYHKSWAELSNDSSKIGHRVQQRGDKGNHCCVIRAGYCYSSIIRPLYYLYDVFVACIYSFSASLV